MTTLARILSCRNCLHSRVQKELPQAVQVSLHGESRDQRMMRPFVCMASVNLGVGVPLASFACTSTTTKSQCWLTAFTDSWVAAAGTRDNSGQDAGSDEGASEAFLDACLPMFDSSRAPQPLWLVQNAVSVGCGSPNQSDTWHTTFYVYVHNPGSSNVSGNDKKPCTTNPSI